MSLHIEQTSEYEGRGGVDWWRWAVWLGGSDAELDRVRAVVYTLHPTFQKPVHRVTDRESAFRLQASGWGEFTIHVRIEREDDSEEELEHWLQLELPAEGAAPVKRDATIPEEDATREAGAVEEDEDQEVQPVEVTDEDLESAPEGAPSAAVGPEPAAREGSSKRSGHRVFLSAGAFEADLMDELREVLEGMGMEVSTGDEIATDRPWHLELDRLIEQSDVFVALRGLTESRWSERETDLARQKGKTVIPVTVGDRPADLAEDVLGVSIDSRDDLPSAARWIADSLTGGSFHEEARHLGTFTSPERDVTEGESV